MPTDTPCPDAGDYDRFLNGLLSEAESLFIEEHLQGGCERCLTLLESFQLQGSVLAQPPSLADAQMLEGLIGRLCALRTIVGAAALEPAPATLSGERLHLTGECELGKEIGRGGMGQVLQGCDLELGRELAVKILRPEYRGEAEAAQRFLEEARVCGRLQHPGVVPVHAVGRLPDGRPYFTMKLIRGQTLAGLLAERTSPGSDLLRIVQIFEQVCQTVAYAHSNGVIHRDLKPANVMVGAFGEVQVMDWGLAKQIAECGLHIAELKTSSSIPHSAIRIPQSTMEGTVMGTPAYMAPEQARGEVGRLDERVDVFGLGAILSEILTGRPPFDDLEQAARSDLSAALARLEACLADVELVGLARGCLAADPDQRPRDGREVAARVAAYRAGVEQRLRQAEIDRARAEVERVAAQQKVLLERKRRRVQLGLAAAVLLLVLSGGTVAWLLQQQDARRRQAAQEVSLRLEHARELLGTGRKGPDLDILAEAKAEADRAVDVARTAGVSDSLQTATAFQQEAQAQVERARQEAKERADHVKRNRILLRDLLDVEDPSEIPSLSEDGEAMIALARPSVDEQYVAAFRRWGDMDIERGSEAEVAARLRQEPETVVQEVLAALDTWMMKRRQRKPPANWQRLHRVADALDRDPRSRQLRGLLVAEVPPPRPEAVAGLLGPWPPWLAMLELSRGQWLLIAERRGQIDPATEPLLTLLLARVSWAAGDLSGTESLLRQATMARPDDVVLLTVMGHLLQERGRPAEAVEYLRAARTRRPELGLRLGVALSNAGRPREREEVLRELLRRQQNNPLLHLHLGLALMDQKKLDEAVAAFRHAITLKPNFAHAYTDLGVALFTQKKLDEAIAAYRQSLALQPDDAWTYNHLGNVLLEQKKLAAAVAAYRRAIDLKPDFAAPYFNLGNALREEKKLDEAVAAYRWAIAVKPDYALAYNNLAKLLYEQNKPDDAIAALRQAIALKPDFAPAYNNLGNALRGQKKLDDAIAAYRRAIALQPEDAETYINLGNALRDQKQLEEAAAACRKAIALKPDFAEAYNNLGNALHDQKKLDDAIAAYRRAIAP
jgi:tetratricopeptide (TPR) repeat protein